MFGIVCFSPACAGQIVRLNCDNSDAVSWLQKSRCSRGIGFRMLAVIELYKHKYCCKISTHYIRGKSNISEDALSRGLVPQWLEKYGTKVSINLDDVANLLLNPLKAWQTIL